MATINISGNPPGINKIEYKDLVVDLLEDFIHGDTSAFTDVVNKYNDYLETSIELDATQKAGAMASFLRDSYSQTSQQVMNSALDLMKSNAELELEAYKTEIDYNMGVVSEQIKQEELIMAGTNKLIKEEELSLTKQKLANDVLAGTKLRAELKKQYGVVESGVTMTFADGTKNYSPWTQNDGTIVWLVTHTSGEYVATDAVVDATNEANNTWNTNNEREDGFTTDLTTEELAVVNAYTDDIYSKVGEYVAGDWELIKSENAEWNVENIKPTYQYDELATTNTAEAKRGATNTNVKFGVTIPDIPGYVGAVDKQIAGYDKVNYKDVLKSLEERTALMQSAKVAETINEAETRVKLINKIMADDVSPVGAAFIGTATLRDEK